MDSTSGIKRIESRNVTRVSQQSSSDEGPFNMTKKQKTAPAEKTRSLLVQLPIPLSDALDLLRVKRQHAEGRLISKKQIVVEAIEKLVATTK